MIVLGLIRTSTTFIISAHTNPCPKPLHDIIMKLMKFIVALGFFASAMALATPVKESNKQHDISVSDLEPDPHDVSLTTRYVRR